MNGEPTQTGEPALEVDSPNGGEVDTKSPFVWVVHPDDSGRAAVVAPRPAPLGADASPNQPAVDADGGEVPPTATEAPTGLPEAAPCVTTDPEPEGPLVGGYTALQRSLLPKDHLYYKNEHPQSVRVNEAQRAHAIKRFKEGVSILGISRELGLSKNAIRDVLKKVPGLLPPPQPTPRGESGTFAKGTSANPGGKPQGALRVQDAFKGCSAQTFQDFKKVEAELMSRVNTTGVLIKEEEALFKMLFKYQTFGLKMAEDKEITLRVAEGVNAQDAKAAADILKAELASAGITE
jgi:hypothetical protein